PEASRARAAAVVWLTRVYRSVHGALCVAPASCQAKSVNATRQPGASNPGPVALGIAGAQDLHPGADEAARTVELDPREAVIVADDHRHRLAERILDDEAREVDADQREAHSIARRAVAVVLDPSNDQRPDAASDLRAAAVGEPLPVW